MFLLKNNKKFNFIVLEFFNSQKKLGFTLAEVLITLGIIGVVAAITIPTLMHNTQEHQFKVAYKKAYSDILNAFSKSIVDETLTPRTDLGDPTATASEWDVMENAFKVIKTCTPAELDECWAPNGESLTPGAYSLPSAVLLSKSFIDSSGRSWAEYNYNENIYLVDTNGAKKPNKFGQDRWPFTLADASHNRISVGLPATVIPFTDKTVANWECHYPPCYYQSWLIGK